MASGRPAVPRAVSSIQTDSCSMVRWSQPPHESSGLRRQGLPRMKLTDSPRTDALQMDVSLALRSRAPRSDSDYSRPLAAWLIHATPQCIKV
jgi:hypothetical protein